MSGEESYDYDAFICHSGEDKEDFVRPLATDLRARGLDVWYDEFRLEIGDNIRESIDQGLSNSDFGIVVLSKSFFEREWTEYELNGLLERDFNSDKVILPIWLDIEKETVEDNSPPLADKYAIEASKDEISKVAGRLYSVIRQKQKDRGITPKNNQIKINSGQSTGGVIPQRALVIPQNLQMSRVKNIFNEIIPDRVYILYDNMNIGISSDSTQEAIGEIKDIIRENSDCFERDEVMEIGCNFYDFEGVLTKTYEILYKEDKEDNKVIVDINGGTTIVGIALSFASSLAGNSMPVYSALVHDIDEKGRYLNGIGSNPMVLTSISSLGFISSLPQNEKRREIIRALNSEPQKKAIVEILTELDKISSNPSDNPEERKKIMNPYYSLASDLVDKGYLNKHNNSKYSLTETGYITARLLDIEKRIDEEFEGA